MGEDRPRTGKEGWDRLGGSRSWVEGTRDGQGSGMVRAQKRSCRKRNPFQGPRVVSCLTLGNELSEESHTLRKQEILLRRAPRQTAGG